MIGLGTMGAGIAEVFARGGLPVTAVEADAGALARGMGIIDGSLNRAVSRGRMSEQDRAEVAGRITPAGSLADLSGADLVIEVVPEQMPIKREIVTGLDQVLRPDAIIATNTSSLSVTTIAAHSAHPDRVIGMHFFNPAPVMKLVEVVTTVLTAPSVGAAVTDLARALGKTPVQVTDRAGFVANALLLPYLNHAIRLLETGYASREDIDLAVTAGIGLPMGPLTLLDLIGLDTSLAVLEVLQHEFGGSRYTPAPLLRRLTDAGRVGRKSGAGFYDYRQADPGQGPGSGQAPDQDQPAAPGSVTVLAEPAAARADELAGLIEQAGITVTRDPGQPSDLVIVAVGPDGGVTGPATAAGRPNDAVGLHLVTPELAEIVAGPRTSEQAVSAARALADRLGLRSVRSPDRPGLLVGALLYPHLRDAVAMVGDGYAAPADVDAAMTLGCGYPRGPMTLLAEAGPDRAVAVLAAMHAAYGDPAFAPHPLLADYVAAAVSPLEYPGR